MSEKNSILLEEFKEVLRLYSYKDLCTPLETLLN